MSDYKVIALKYRPQTFEEVVGQDHITQTLKNAIAQGRIAHAYLLVGPRGTGKTTTARIFAKALNCKSSDKPTPSPCGKCSSCVEIAAGSSMSVLEIDGASNRGIDEIRSLRESVAYAPAGVRYKIYIVDEVHMLTKEAFNALLKTLEEPPAHVKFVFATTEPQKVLPTILSRCQRFDFHRIPQDLIVRHLEQIAKSEKIEITREALMAIARGAEGGMRDAESALDQLIAFCGAKVNEQDVLSIFGLVSAEQLRGIVDALLRGDSRTVIETLDRIAEQGKDLVRLLTELMEALRNILVTQSGVAAVDKTKEAQDWLQGVAGRISTRKLLRMIDVLAEAEAPMRYALSKKIFFEISLIKAAQTLDEVSLDEVIAKLARLEPGQEGPAGGGTGESTASGGGGPNPVPPAKRPATAPKPASQPTAARALPTPLDSPASGGRTGAVEPSPSSDPALEKTWMDLLERVEKVSKMLRNALSRGRLVEVTADRVVIGFDPEFSIEKASVETPKFHTQLHTKVRELLHREVELRIVTADDPKIPQPHSAPTDDSSRRKFEDDPLIKKAMEVFKSQILEVRK